MKAVLQRVLSASVKVEGEEVGATRNPATGDTVGLLVLLGVQAGDSEADSAFLARKTAELRIFQDDEGKMNRSVQEVNGSILVISQFTLIADWRKGRRPGFSGAAPPAEGERLYVHFVEELKKLGVAVENGIFGADMKVSLVNDGPVTIVMDTRESNNS
jgi:D-tyrosyl-tRNA(Tyr) deacylase